MQWRALGRPDVRDKAVREERATGLYLGVIAFEPMSRSGLHQHLGTALSYFLAGADKEDIVQEGMIGLYKAIRDFQSDKNTAFRAFAELCMTRQIITAILRPNV